MHECFRPGDIVRAEVLSLGDARCAALAVTFPRYVGTLKGPCFVHRSYFLTTAKNELGVVYAKSAAAGE